LKVLKAGSRTVQLSLLAESAFSWGAIPFLLHVRAEGQAVVGRHFAHAHKLAGSQTLAQRDALLSTASGVLLRPAGCLGFKFFLKNFSNQVVRIQGLILINNALTRLRCNGKSDDSNQPQSPTMDETD
jgi:hypothetical protein